MNTDGDNLETEEVMNIDTDRQMITDRNKQSNIKKNHFEIDKSETG